MRLLDITARAHPSGYRIDLAWTNPEPGRLPGVRVMRRERTHPLTPDDGHLVAEGPGLTTATDTRLRGETAYYYTLFPFSGAPPVYEPDLGNRASAIATASYDYGGLLYVLLPAVYQRFDAALTPPPGSGVGADDATRGQLRRYLDLPGQQLDALYSLTRALLDVQDVDQVEGRLLPLLASWIGWPTDEGLAVSGQRTEIRLAPRLYAQVGAAPAARSTVARVTGWPSRVKEYVHNVARTNTPEQLTLWSATRDAAGTWSPAAPVSTNAAFSGRPAHVTDTDDSQLFVYTTLRGHGPDVWGKRFDGGGWQPSEPLVDRPGIDQNPTAALQGDTLWLFWESLDPSAPPDQQRWRISFRTRTPAQDWSPIAVFADVPAARRNPAATVDDTGGLWLFWREWLDGRWQVRFNRHDGAAWQLDPPATLPDDGGALVLVEDDLVALHHPAAPGRIWLFWARRQPGGPPGQTRWTIALRVKAGLDPTAADWSAVGVVPKDDAADRDREPYPLPTAAGDVELVHATTRGGVGWTLVSSVLDGAAGTWGPITAVGPPAAGGSRRAPAVAALPGPDDGTLLLFRSAASVIWTPDGAVAAAGPAPGPTLDSRYAGTRTVLADDAAARTRRGRFDDDAAYTYDSGAAQPEGPPARGDADRAARDTVGVFLTPDTADPAVLAAALRRLGPILGEFLPMTARAVLLDADGEVIPR